MPSQTAAIAAKPRHYERRRRRIAMQAPTTAAPGGAAVVKALARHGQALTIACCLATSCIACMRMNRQTPEPSVGSSSRVPPRWKPDIHHRGGQSFRQWSQELALWTKRTDLPPDQQVAAVILRLEGSAREAVNHLSPQEIANGGVLEGALHSPMEFLMLSLANYYYANNGEETRLNAMTNTRNLRLQGDEHINNHTTRSRSPTRTYLHNNTYCQQEQCFGWDDLGFSHAPNSDHLQSLSKQAQHRAPQPTHYAVSQAAAPGGVAAPGHTPLSELPNRTAQITNAKHDWTVFGSNRQFGDISPGCRAWTTAHQRSPADSSPPRAS